MIPPSCTDRNRGNRGLPGPGFHSSGHSGARRPQSAVGSPKRCSGTSAESLTQSGYASWRRARRLSIPRTLCVTGSTPVAVAFNTPFTPGGGPGGGVEDGTQCPPVAGGRFLCGKDLVPLPERTEAGGTGLRCSTTRPSAVSTRFEPWDRNGDGLAWAP